MKLVQKIEGSWEHILIQKKKINYEKLKEKQKLILKMSRGFRKTKMSSQKRSNKFLMLKLLLKSTYYLVLVI